MFPKTYIFVPNFQVCPYLWLFHSWFIQYKRCFFSGGWLWHLHWIIHLESPLHIEWLQDHNKFPSRQVFPRSSLQWSIFRHTCVSSDHSWRFPCFLNDGEKYLDFPWQMQNSCLLGAWETFQSRWIVRRCEFAQLMAFRHQFNNTYFPFKFKIIKSLKQTIINSKNNLLSKVYLFMSKFPVCFRHLFLFKRRLNLTDFTLKYGLFIKQRSLFYLVFWKIMQIMMAMVLLARWRSFELFFLHVLHDIGW